MTLTISRHVKAQKSLQHRMKWGGSSQVYAIRALPFFGILFRLWHYRRPCNYINTVRALYILWRKSAQAIQLPFGHAEKGCPRNGTIKVSREASFCTCCENAGCIDIGIPFIKRRDLDRWIHPYGKIWANTQQRCSASRDKYKNFY